MDRRKFLKSLARAAITVTIGLKLSEPMPDPPERDQPVWLAVDYGREPSKTYWQFRYGPAINPSNIVKVDTA